MIFNKPGARPFLRFKKTSTDTLGPNASCVTDVRAVYAAKRSRPCHPERNEVDANGREGAGHPHPAPRVLHTDYTTKLRKQLSIFHHPALLEEAITYLDIQPDGTYLDLTFGGGGHARAILEHLKGGTLWAIDQDPAALEQAKKITHPGFHFIQANFRFFTQLLRHHHVTQVNGILADLGTSWHQLDRPERGFAARLSGPLDMRMHQQGTRTAADIVNTYKAHDLVALFQEYGDVPNSHKLVQALCAARSQQPITTTAQLQEIAQSMTPKWKEYQYLAKVFQALRIAVNDEHTALEEMLFQLPTLLAPRGRVVIISYHSGEDRRVKNFFKTGNLQGEPQKDLYGNLIRPLTPLTTKVIQPTKEEVAANNRIRSAKLRAAERATN